MKYVLYGLLGLIVLAVAVVLVGPGLVDWNAHKAEITAQFEKATGRALAIEGDINLQIVPTPSFSAANVRLANLPGGSAQDMAIIKALQVRVELMPLLSGDVRVQTIELVEPVILMEVLEDGRRNWDVGDDGEPGGGAGESVAAPRQIGDFPVDVRFDSFTISNGTLIYRDAQGGIDEKVEKVDVELAAESLRGPLLLDGEVRLRGVETGVELAIGRWTEAGAIPLRMALRPRPIEAKAKFSGSLSQHPDTLAFRGKLQAEGSDLAQAVAALAGQPVSDQPSQLALPFVIETEISGEPEEISAQKIAITLGESSATGEGLLRLGDKPEGKLAVTIPRLDLDALSPPETEASEGGAAAPATEGGETAADIAIPKDFVARLDLGIEALVYREQVVRQVAVAARIENGVLAVDQAAALLPGGAAVSLSGGFEAGAKDARFVGRVEAATSNLRSQLAWLGVDVEHLPADRLRRMNLRSSLAASAKRIDLTDLDLTLDISQINGGVVVALGKRPAFGIGLAADKLDLDAYLPAGPITAESEPGDGGDGEPESGLWSRFDANLNVQVGELTAQDNSYRDVALAGTLQEGKLTLKEGRIGDFVGSRLEVKGTVDKLDEMPKADLQLKLGMGDPGRLAQALGMDPELYAKLGPSEISGSVAGDPAAFDLDLTIDSLGGKFATQGRVQPLEGAGSFDLAVSAEHRNLAFLLSRLADPALEDRNLGLMDLKAKLTGTATAFRLDDLQGRLGESNLEGRLAVDLDGERPKVAAELSSDSLPLAALLGAGARSAGGSSTDRPAGGRSNGRWSRTPIDVAGFLGFDAELKLTAAALALEDLRLEEASLDAELQDGILNLRNLAGGFLGGKLTVIGKADLRGEIELGAGISAVDVDLKPLLLQQFDFDRAAGPVTMNADLVSRGRSEHDLISSLDGQGTIEGKVTVTAKQEEQVGAALLGVLGQKLKQIQGVADASMLLLGSFAGTPATLSGSFVLENGVATTRDTQLTGQGAVARLAGQADLVEWTLESETEVFRDAQPGEAYLSVGLTGALDKPNVRVGGQAFQRRKEPEPEPAPQPAIPVPEEPGLEAPDPAGATAAEEEPPAPEAAAQPEWTPPAEDEVAPPAPGAKPEPAEPEPAKPEDFIKQILEGLQSPPAE
ncbi:MAG: AsmA family protein [Kiloniellales bacterium]|nr:AsmA family protein [Kiloniellales bacterium]